MSIKKIYETLILVNTGQIILFDLEGKQVAKLQAKFSNNLLSNKSIDRKLLLKIAKKSKNHYFAKYRECLVKLDETEFIKLFC